MDIHRRDPDRANGVPNRGGMFALIGLQFDPVQSEDSGGWLTVCPPTCWDMSWEDFIADTCHGMFGFEKPRWHYIPEFGALVDALAKAAQTLPDLPENRTMLSTSVIPVLSSTLLGLLGHRCPSP